MKKVIVFVFEKFNQIYRWLNYKDRFGIKRSGYIIIGLFVLLLAIGHFSKSEVIVAKMIYIFILILFFLMLIFLFDTDSKIVSVISCRRYSTPRELLGEMTHCSYLYGLVPFSFGVTYFIELIYSICTIIITETVKVLDLKTVWIVSVFSFTLLYFLYHIYVSEMSRHIELARLRIQFYSAIGTSISFLMLLYGEVRLFKLIVTGTMMEYIWLQYFISKEIEEHGTKEK